MASPSSPTWPVFLETAASSFITGTASSAAIPAPSRRFTTSCNPTVSNGVTVENLDMSFSIFWACSVPPTKLDIVTSMPSIFAAMVSEL